MLKAKSSDSGRSGGEKRHAIRVTARLISGRVATRDFVTGAFVRHRHATDWFAEGNRNPNCKRSRYYSNLMRSAAESRCSLGGVPLSHRRLSASVLQKGNTRFSQASLPSITEVIEGDVVANCFGGVELVHIWCSRSEPRVG